MKDPDLSCREDLRRETVRAASLFGLDYVEIGDVEGPDDHRNLRVYFLGKAPPNFGKKNLVLTGGRRIRDFHIVNLRVVRQKDPTLDDHLEIDVDKPGDFSTYTLSVVEVDDKGQPTTQPMAGFDQRYSSVTFSFRAGCPSDLDCKQPDLCPPPQRAEPEINYLAKDYSSFRQLILDRLALIMPDWTETHVPDIGVTLVEMLAYTGDYLSYYQDAVATEAYLGTARERISVRRHARLVDYAMHEGCNARTWMTLWTSDKTDLDPAQIYFITPFPNAPEERVLSDDDLRNVPSLGYEVFQPLTTGVCRPPNGKTISIWPAHNEIYFYTWGDCECCLATGSTSATLVDQWVKLPTEDKPSPETPQKPGKEPSSGKPAPSYKTSQSQLASVTRAPKGPIHHRETVPTEGSTVPSSSDVPPGTERMLKLKAGDVLIFEEVKGAKNGNPDDADPRHRQAVRLTKVTPTIDPLYQPYQDSFGPEFVQPVLEIEWASEDALTFPLCISSQAPPPDCGCMENVSVARGNVILVDHGRDAGEQLGTVPTESTTEKCPSCCQPAEIQIVSCLFRPVLTQQPLTFSEPLASCGASDSVFQDPRQALPWISLASIPPGPGCSDSGSVNPSPASEKSASAQVASPPCEVKPLFTFDDLSDPTGLAKTLQHAGSSVTAQFLLAQLSGSTRSALSAWDGTSSLPEPLRTGLLTDLNAMLEYWRPRADLLESGPSERVFVVEIDNQGFAHLRFGDGLLGMQPKAGTAFRADYRIGNGKAGNVGAETITYIVFRKGKLSGLTIKPRNPFAGMGGDEPEPIDDVKMFAPFAFKSTLERAIRGDDYAALASDNSRRLKSRSALVASMPAICTQPFRSLQRAKATLCWMGSWYTAQVALDPMGSEEINPTLIQEITSYLLPFRRLGHDLMVGPARYVPLSVVISVCVMPNYLRGHVERAVLDVLSNRRLANGRLGFFHPDNLTFGTGIFVSRLLTAVQAVPGVQDVTVNELERFEISEPDADIENEEVPANSVLELGPMEIARLDNDPDFPENGRLFLNIRGGR
jgi:hypothetical protein